MSLKSKLEKMPGYNSLVRPVHFLQAIKAGQEYGWPGKKLRVIGVTGTNGKTTTCFMIWKMLNEGGHRTGLLTTVGWATGADDLHAQVEHMTTERVGILDKRMRAVADGGAEFLVLETTSHALMQSRTLGVPIEIAVFTNLTHEHLDYHKTFEKYRKAKMKLFRGAGYGVINSDDKSAGWFIKAVAGSAENHDKYITYGINSGELQAKEVKLGEKGVEYALGDMNIKTQIPGEFNVYNSLAAVAVGEKLGLSKQEIEKGIFALEGVAGRMEKIEEGQEFTVIVDYAHTPDALEKVLASNFPRFDAKKGAPSEGGLRVIAVHGGAGRRDESTREIRGEILGKYADMVIITEDDSRDEDPEAIAAQFVKGAAKAGKKLGQDLFVELDREQAIREALTKAKKGDLVLILGKGHEKTILRKDGAHEFEDAKVARGILKKLKGRK